LISFKRREVRRAVTGTSILKAEPIYMRTRCVECGHTEPKLETLEKWAKALDLELYQLFYQGKRKPVAPKVVESR
jgi:hypothetical protein